MRTGEHSGYKWIESTSYSLSELLKCLPQAIVGRCVAIAAFDSGLLKPTPEELALGWMYTHDVAFSPIVSNASELPYDGFDEWYILDGPRDLGPLEVFVNYCGFRLSDPGERGELRDPARDAVAWRYDIAVERERQEQFWAQIERVGPETCILDGDSFVLATRNPDLHEAVVQWHTSKED